MTGGTTKTKPMRSPLGRVRGLGSAHAGTHHWWLQRLTALALVPLSIWFIGAFFIYGVLGGYNEAIQWLRNPFAATGMILVISVGFYHAMLGLQVVIEDYVHAEGLKLTSLILVKFLAAALALLGILTTVKILLGA